MRRYVVIAVLAGCGSVSGSNTDAAVHDSRSIDGAADARGIDAIGCAANPTGLGGRWRADGNVTDELGVSTGTTGGNVAYTPGKHGMAFLLDGASHVAINDGDMLWPMASYSLEAWIKVTTSTATQIIMQKYQCGNTCVSGNSNAVWGLYLDANGIPEFDSRPDSGGAYAIVKDTTHNIADGQWHQIIGVRDTVNNNQQLFLDGQLVVTATLATGAGGVMTNTDNDVDAITIGAGYAATTTNPGGFLTGAIDEVSYYASALTASQVAAIYAAPLGECPH